MRSPAIDQHPAVLVDVDDICRPGARSRCCAHHYLSFAVSSVEWSVDITHRALHWLGTLYPIAVGISCAGNSCYAEMMHYVLHLGDVLHWRGDSGPDCALCSHVDCTVEC